MGLAGGIDPPEERAQLHPGVYLEPCCLQDAQHGVETPALRYAASLEHSGTWDWVPADKTTLYPLSLRSGCSGPGKRFSP